MKSNKFFEHGKSPLINLKLMENYRIYSPSEEEDSQKWKAIVWFLSSEQLHEWPEKTFWGDIS